MLNIRFFSEWNTSFRFRFRSSMLFFMAFFRESRTRSPLKTRLALATIRISVRRENSRKNRVIHPGSQEPFAKNQKALRNTAWLLRASGMVWKTTKKTKPYRLVMPSSRKNVSPKHVIFFRIYCMVSRSAGDITNSRMNPLNR